MTEDQIELVEIPGAKCPKETFDVFKFIAKVYESQKLALADGWQPGQDIPAIALASYQEALAALSQGQKVPAETKAHPGKVAMGVAWVTDKILSDQPVSV